MTHTSRRRALALAALALAACSGPAPQGATQVKMHDNAFNAPVVRVPAGAGVTFANAGRNAHNIVPVDPAKWPAAAKDTSALAPGASRTIALDSAGVYEYYCAYHGSPDGRGMAGAVVVGDVQYAGGPKGDVPPASAPTGRVRRVPREYATIQGAVDASVPGDLVLVDTGTYKEEVTITTPSLVIRGVDRNLVVVDGEFIRPNGFNVLADGVALENLTARNHTFNGFFWNGVTGYRGRWLTAYNNGDYGVYAFDSKDGLIEDSYASGSPDAGFYIGQCDPCDAVIRRVMAEHNAIGYSGTNSSGELHIVSSTWRYNRAGIVPNTLDTELHPPQHGTTIRANLIYGNHSRSAPGKDLTAIAWGNGIVVGGGRDNVIEGNQINSHAGHGVMIAPFRDANWWPARGNIVRGNEILRSGRADVSVGGPTSAGNCVGAQGNEVRRAPRALGCTDGEVSGVQNDLVPLMALAFRMVRLRSVEFPDWRAQPVPPPQPVMPEARTAPAELAHGVYAKVRGELAAPPLPPEADSVTQAARERPGLPVHTSPMGVRIQRAQAWVPFTPKLVALVLVLLVAMRVAASRRAGARIYWRLGVVAALAWTGLALAAAVTLSAM